jgi:hypothetical protein
MLANFGRVRNRLLVELASRKPAFPVSVFAEFAARWSDDLLVTAPVSEFVLPEGAKPY